MKTPHTIFIVIPVFFVAACASTMSDAPVGPAEYRQGYSAGCDSGYSAAGHVYYRFNKEPIRYETDRLYAQGWNDGFVVCKARHESTQRMLGPIF